MSTKAIRLVLGKALMEHPITHEEMRAAQEAVQAIERAARELLEIWGYARHAIEAEKVMESIAKEAP